MQGYKIKPSNLYLHALAQAQIHLKEIRDEKPITK